MKKGYALNQLSQILVRRLEEKGMEPGMIPGFIKSLVRTLMDDPEINLPQVNQQLHSLGWDDFELDYHTFQLAIACLEAEDLDHLEQKPPACTKPVLNRRTRV